MNNTKSVAELKADPGTKAPETNILSSEVNTGKSVGQDSVQALITSHSSTEPVTKSVSTQRKPRFEFSHSNGSVIFLDEIKKPNANESAVVQPGLKEKINTQSSALNGIKFGFMDSSSSEDSANEEDLTKNNSQEVIANLEVI